MVVLQLVAGLREDRIQEGLCIYSVGLKINQVQSIPEGDPMFLRDLQNSLL